MKTVILVRHGKASRDDQTIPDLQRPLTAEGGKRTKKIASFLSDKKVPVQKIITSNAVRAFETAKILACELEIDKEDFIVEDSIYEAATDDIFDVLFPLPDELNAVMLVGHNPSFHRFAAQFMPEPVESLPTSGVVSIRFHTDKWINTGSCRADIEFMVFPSMLK